MNQTSAEFFCTYFAKNQISNSSILGDQTEHMHSGGLLHHGTTEPRQFWSVNSFWWQWRSLRSWWRRRPLRRWHRRRKRYGTMATSWLITGQWVWLTGHCKGGTGDEKGMALWHYGNYLIDYGPMSMIDWPLQRRHRRRKRYASYLIDYWLLSLIDWPIFSAFSAMSQ